jgi:hypothetical protein
MKLHLRVKHQDTIIRQLKHNIKCLEDYLNLEKFSVDISVNKHDILLRIQEGKNFVIDLENQA